MTTKARNPGHDAERKVADEYGLEKPCSSRETWADLCHPDTGTERDARQLKLPIKVFAG